MAAADYTSLVQSLYVSYFGRPADSFALANFAAQLDGLKAPTTSSGLAAAYKTSAGLKSLIDSFGTSQESKDLYGTDDLAFVTSVYRNAFNREPDFEGLMFWTNAIRSGSLSKANAALTIVAESVNNASVQGKSDAALIANKVTVAANFTAAIDTGAELAAYNGNAAAATARAMLSAVTATTLAVDLQANVEATLATLVANANPGTTQSLTAGLDNLVGTGNNDIFNAFSFNAVSGGDAKTLNAFDTIDGGAGRDTLNIQLKAATGNTLADLGTVKNVEIINITEDAATVVDASKFVGATAINQIGNAGNVTNLAAGTTAGFNGISTNMNVTAAGAAAAVAFTGVAEAASLTVSGATLASVSVSGTRADTDASGSLTGQTLAVTAGKDVQSLTVNTNQKTTLTVAEDSTSTKKVATVDASASTGAITFVGDADTMNIKTGSAGDTVTIAAATVAAAAGAAAVNASLSTGAGNDIITVGNAGTGLTSVDAGAGNDTITVTKTAGGALNVQGGEGNDSIAISGVLSTTDVISGGAGTDTVSMAGAATRAADDYIVFNKLITGFEAIKFTSAEGALDASQLAANYVTIDLATGSTVDNVGTQAIVARGDLNVEAKGFVYDVAGSTYAGSLNITERTTGIVSAGAESVALTVQAATSATGGVAATLVGDVKSAAVTLANSVNASSGATLDTIASVIVNTTADNVDMTSLTLKGNGSASVTNAAGSELVTVDASALGGVYTLGANAGKAIAGLTYTSTNAAAETVKLGAGIDSITLGASTYGKVDTVSGLNLVVDTTGAAPVLAGSSDILKVTGASGAKAFTTTQTDLDLALKDAAASTVGETLVFKMGGDTYVFVDTAAAVTGAIPGAVDATDIIVKIAGNVDLDALILSLA